ncbi:hypothetical protein [Brevibacillus migulae]|uniref:hypothetical protein n=1 Tax=Brevibacillus migulae TaxID=1644114 RepID=UPI00106EB98E|nr:hypothetical protein [Brevibacillus migulae]
MNGPFRPVIIPDPNIQSPGPDTVGQFLEETGFADLYRLAGDEGLPYFVRLNGEGVAELYLVFENIEAFSEATSDAVSIEFKTYQQKLLAIIWTLTDPQNPLGFPLSFDISKEEDRFMALTLIEQAGTPIHYLAYMDQRILHIFSETITFSQEEKTRATGYVRRLYEQDSTDQAPAEEEVKEGELLSIPASVLSDEILLQSGTVYRFRHPRSMGQEEREEAEALLMNTLQQSLLVVRRHARSEVRESACTVWAGQEPEHVSLYITPELHSLFEDIHTADGEANPFTRFLRGIPSFEESKPDTPLKRGAYPILRYDAGQLYHLELEETFQERLLRLAEEAGWQDVSANPYR